MLGGGHRYELNKKLLVMLGQRFRTVQERLLSSELRGAMFGCLDCRILAQKKPPKKLGQSWDRSGCN